MEASQRASMLLIGHQVILCLKWCFAETQGIDGFLASSLGLFPGTSLERRREGDINQCASVLSSCLLLSSVNDIPPQWSGVRLQDNSSTPGKKDTDLISSSRDFIKKVKLVKYLTFVNVHRGDLQKEFDIELVINTYKTRGDYKAIIYNKESKILCKKAKIITNFTALLKTLKYWSEHWFTEIKQTNQHPLNNGTKV